MDAQNDTKFWAKVDMNGPVPEHMPHLGQCWIWLGRTFMGYGMLDRNGVTYRAHRYVMGNPELCVLHHCDNPPCVNPSHLFLGTRADNVRDCQSKNRLAKFRHNLRMWTTVDVLTMRVMRDEGCTYQAIADAFNTRRSRVYETLHKYYRDTARININY